MAKEKGTASPEILSSEEKRTLFLEKVIYPVTKNKWVRLAFSAVNRQEFVPEKFQDIAWDDRIIPLPGSNITQPSLLAYQMDLLELDGSGDILEIGTGRSGLSSTYLSLCAENVYTIDRDEHFVKEAAALASKKGYGNIHYFVGDGLSGVPEHGPYKAIILHGAVKFVQNDLLTQLEDGGILIAPEGDDFEMCTLMIYKRSKDKVSKYADIEVLYMPLISLNPGGWSEEEVKTLSDKRESFVLYLLSQIVQNDDQHRSLKDIQMQFQKENPDLYIPSVFDLNRILVHHFAQQGIISQLFPEDKP